jgi:hypothetical protein
VESTERILSPRILHFTKHQIFWDCGTLSACEVFPNGLPFPLDHKASTDRHWRGRLVGSTVSSNALTGVNDNESSYTFWMSAVQNYTECNLTSQGDKTIAIWSIAKLLRDVMREQYAVGMWSEALEEQMAWRVRETQKCENMPDVREESVETEDSHQLWSTDKCGRGCISSSSLGQNLQRRHRNGRLSRCSTFDYSNQPAAMRIHDPCRIGHFEQHQWPPIRPTFFFRNMSDVLWYRSSSHHALCLVLQTGNTAP